MKRRKLIVLLPIMVVAVIIVSGVAISGSEYTWEKTFEVTKPEIECEIEISDCKVVGYPVKIWVMLKLEGDCGRCWHECREEWRDRCFDDWKDRCYDHWKGECDDCEGGDWEDKCFYQINGTYSVDLYWWNETHADWKHMMYLQEEINTTLTGWRHIETYTFTPEMEGEYKVVVNFATETETVSFSSED